MSWLWPFLGVLLVKPSVALKLARYKPDTLECGLAKQSGYLEFWAFPPNGKKPVKVPLKTKRPKPLEEVGPYTVSGIVSIYKGDDGMEEAFFAAYNNFMDSAPIGSWIRFKRDGSTEKGKT